MFERGKTTEYKSKPDFLFPSAELYRKAGKEPALRTFLNMLAAKTSCKDRWRQITKEAALIDMKHLITLEAAISVDQTDEMKRNNVQLIVPEGIRSSYTSGQHAWLMTLSDFIAYMRERQAYYRTSV